MCPAFNVPGMDYTLLGDRCAVATFHDAVAEKFWHVAFRNRRIAAVQQAEARMGCAARTLSARRVAVQSLALLIAAGLASTTDLADFAILAAVLFGDSWEAVLVVTAATTERRFVVAHANSAITAAAGILITCLACGAVDATSILRGV